MRGMVESEIRKVRNEDQIPVFLYKIGMTTEPTHEKYREFEKLNHLSLRRMSSGWSGSTFLGVRIDLEYHLKINRGNDTFKAAVVKSGIFDLDVFKDKIQDMILLAGQRLLEKQERDRELHKRNMQKKAILDELGLKSERFCSDYSRGSMKFNVGLPEDHFVRFTFDITYLPDNDRIDVRAYGLTKFLADKLIRWCRETIGEEIKGEEND